MAERGTWQTILNMLVVLFAVIQQHNFNRVAVQNGSIAIVDMIHQAELARQFVWDPNNRANCNRGIDSFSEEECWRMFRFRKEDLPILFQDIFSKASITLSRVVIGSKLPGDMSLNYRYRYKTISQMTQSMESGESVAFKDLESIHGSLYDMLNQNYTIVGIITTASIAASRWARIATP
jgi:hypothetical protein